MLVAEVKRQAKNFKPETFREKAAHLRDSVLCGRKIETRLLTLDDMERITRGRDEAARVKRSDAEVSDLYICMDGCDKLTFVNWGGVALWCL